MMAVTGSAGDCYSDLYETWLLAAYERHLVAVSCLTL